MRSRHVLCAFTLWNLVCGVASAQTLQPGSTLQPTSRDRSPAPYVDIFVGGSVRQLTDGADSPANVSGALGLRYRGQVFLVSGLINVASTEDTIRSAFGGTLLPPASGRALNAGLLDIRAPRLPFNSVGKKCASDPHAIVCHVGLHAYFSASSALWASEFDDDGTVVASMIVPTWGTGIGGSYTFINGELNDSNTAAMILDLGVVTRHLRGDITGRDLIRQDLLGSTRTDYVGIEVGLNLQYNSLQGGLTYYYMPGDVDGFSRGQVVAGFSIQADLNSSQLRL